MNGFNVIDDDYPNFDKGVHDQTCCLSDNGDRCNRPAGNASYSKRIEKTVGQRKLKLSLDVNVSILMLQM